MQLKTFVYIVAFVFVAFLIFLRKLLKTLHRSSLELIENSVLSTCMGEPISAWASELWNRTLQHAESSSSAYKRSLRDYNRVGSSSEEMEMHRVYGYGYEDEPAMTTRKR